ncbi:MAG: cytochrome c3 family protein [Bacteroidota bacterium]|nr:cytochrome c3 family protein [Bacteroidota bacterium]
MRTTTIRTLLVLACAFLIPPPAAAQQDECLTCHEMMDDAAATAFTKGVHRRAGLTCASCHGGDATSDDMEVGMSPARGFKGVPSGQDISTACGKCHDDAERMANFGYEGPTGQLTTLLGSAHSRHAGESKQLLLQCTDCHGAHGIRHAEDPASPVSPLRVVELCSSCHSDPSYMRRYNPSLPTDQLAKYRTSVHGAQNLRGNSKTATCADCHTAHDIRPATESTSSVNALNIPETCGRCHSDPEYMRGSDLPTTQLAEFRSSVHGKALLDRRELSAPSCNDCHGNHGAAPPNVASISNVCGTCHALNADLFQQSRHATEFARMGKPECETCHGNHAVQPATLELLALDSGSPCADCHSESTAPQGYRAAMQMRMLLDSLMETVATAEKRLDAAEQKGMEIDNIRFSLRDARQARLQSRTAVHAFSLEKFREVVDPGLAIARQALVAAEDANDEYYYRRHGLAVATLFITLTIVLLALHIRRIERRQKKERDTQGDHTVS